MRLGLPISVLLALVTLPMTKGATWADVAGGTYLGQASTGEAVYYVGARFQCGDLPRTDECWWRTPMVVYHIGQDAVTAIADCQQQVFREVWLDGEVVARNMRPQSEAIRLVIENACQRR
jgi:hypothetical protein